MQVCTSLQTDNHASTQPLSFLQAGCSSCRPTNSVKALKDNYTVILVVSEKWFKIDTLLLHTISRKCHLANRSVTFPVTLDNLEGHSLVAGLNKCNSMNICATFRKVSTDAARRAFPRRQLSFLFYFMLDMRAPSATLRRDSSSTSALCKLPTYLLTYPLCMRDHSGGNSCQ